MKLLGDSALLKPYLNFLTWAWREVSNNSLAEVGIHPEYELAAEEDHPR